MRAPEAVRAIRAEIKWCRENKNIGKTPDYEAGFIAGLKQALRIIITHPIVAEFGRKGGSAKVPKGFAKTGKASEAGKNGAEARWKRSN